ncbi:hypothetical protein [Brevibacillus daliensis]|uniref:hypothetical protein n=1 Tax=Brevibacillus daliensis TaxID=2892995 RepID=UPI001E3DDD43|nr:hypothetical protein [Brevibacillus daliensis]
MRKLVKIIIIFLVIVNLFEMYVPLQTNASSSMPVSNFHGAPESITINNNYTPATLTGDTSFDFEDLVYAFTEDKRNPLGLEDGTEFRLHKMYVYVDGEIPDGSKLDRQLILSLVEHEKSSDNGYPMINLEHKDFWIKKLGGDIRFVSQNITVYTIKPNNFSSSFQVVSLAQLIELCGGMGGGRFGFEPYKVGHAKYIAYAEFTQTKIPKGSIEGVKQSYMVNDTVTITGKAEAFSAYNRGIIVDKFTVYNKSTGGSYKEIVPAGTKSPSSWKSSAFAYKVTEPGIYEVNLYVKDYHWRIAEEYPYTKTFVVGGVCDPTTSATKTELLVGKEKVTLFSNESYQLPKDTDSITLRFSKTGTLRINNAVYQTGQTFSSIDIRSNKQISFTSTDGVDCWTQEFLPAVIDLPECEPTDEKFFVASYGSDVFKERQEASGGSFWLDENSDTVRVEAPSNGTFYLNGNPINEQSKNWISISVAPYASFTISYTSDDGSECWTKNFHFMQTTVDCPKYSFSNSGRDPIASGERVQVQLNGELDVYAFNRDEDVMNAPVYLMWKIQKPDGKIYTMNQYYHDNGRTGKSGWRDSPTNHLKLPSPNSYDKEVRMVFDQIGDYKIWAVQEWDEDFVDCPPWHMIVEVKPLSCDDFVIEVEEENMPIESVNNSITLKPGKHELVFYNRFLSDVSGETLHEELIRDQDGKVIKESYDVYVIEEESEASYTYRVKFKKGYLVCEKYIKIYIGTFTCDDTKLKVRVNGESPDIKGGKNNRSINLEVGRTHNLEVAATYNGKIENVQATWRLMKDGQLVAEGVDNPFLYTLQENNPTTYTLEVKANINGRECLQTLKITFKGKDCEDLYLHFYNGIINDYSYDIDGGHKVIRGSSLKNWHLVVTDNKYAADESVGTSIILANWSASIPNQSSQPSKRFEGENTGPGTYLITATINDPRYPELQGCQLSFTIEINPDIKEDCSKYFLHSVQAGGKFNYNIHNKKITIEEGTDFAVFISTSKDMVQGTTTDVLWRVSPEIIPPTNRLGAIRFEQGLPVGTYQISGQVYYTGSPESDNCIYAVTVEIVKAGLPECPECNPGGEIDGGQITLRLFDSTNRLLQGKTDGVWEKEPLKIEVIINQTRINEGFSEIDQAVQRAVDTRKAQLESMLQSKQYEEITITANPDPYQSKSNAKWPASTPMKIAGPGTPAQFSIDPKKSSQFFTYTGTITPTETTWREGLNPTDYQVKVDGFEIKIPYRIDLFASFKQCTEDIDTGEKICKDSTDQYQLENQFIMKIKGAQTEFQVFEPNAKGVLEHTDEWKEYHSRDRYKASKPQDYYAGERILTRVILEERHKHPISKKYPSIISAEAWISEKGKRNDSLLSQLPLKQSSPALWKANEQTVIKLGNRELGVDTPLMGDKQKGFEKDKSYAVFFDVEFAFGVKKGHLFQQKQNGKGHSPADYRVPFTIIANAWERQGIRNHITH